MHCNPYFALCLIISITMPGDTMQSIPIRHLTFNWDSLNLHEQWKLFREQCQFLLIDRPYLTHTEAAHIAVVLNWMGQCSYQICSNLTFPGDEGQEETRCF